MDTILIIESLLQKHHISANRMMSDLGFGNSTFTVWKKRGTTPSSEALAKIADYFNVSVDYLLGRADAPQVQNEPAVLDGKPLDEQDLKLLHLLRSMSPEDKDWLVSKIDALLSLK